MHYFNELSDSGQIWEYNLQTSLHWDHVPGHLPIYSLYIQYKAPLANTHHHLTTSHEWEVSQPLSSPRSKQHSPFSGPIICSLSSFRMCHCSANSDNALTAMCGTHSQAKLLRLNLMCLSNQVSSVRADMWTSTPPPPRHTLPSSLSPACQYAIPYPCSSVSANPNPSALSSGTIIPLLSTFSTSPNSSQHISVVFRP